MVRAKLYLSAYSALSLLMVGCTTLSWPSPMLIKLSNLIDNPLYKTITSTENSWMASLGVLGTCIGSFTCGPLASRYGRRTILILLSFPLLIFYLAILFAHNIFLFYISRFGTGFAAGGALAVSSLYIGEIAPPERRGFLGVSLSIFINIGLLIPYSIGPFVSFFYFHVILCFLSGILIPFLYLFAIESPYYIFSRDEMVAENVLKSILGSTDVTKELKEISETLNRNFDRDFFDTIKSKESKKAFLIMIAGFTFANFIGTEVISAYTQTIFESAGNNVNPEIGPICVGITQLLSSTITSLIADRLPRKVLYSIAHAGVALVEIPLGFYFFMKENGYDVTKIEWVPLVCLVLYAFFFNIGITPIIMTLVGEIFPARIKEFGVSFCTTYYWATGFILTFLFNILKEKLGMGYLFWLFAIFGICAVIFINTCVIETKGKTLKEIQEKLGEL